MTQHEFELQATYKIKTKYYFKEKGFPCNKYLKRNILLIYYLIQRRFGA